MKLYRDGKLFKLKLRFDQRHLASEAGFDFHPSTGWATRSPRVADRLREYADRDVRHILDRSLIRYSPWAVQPPHPAHLTPYDFQYEGAKFCLARNRSYLAGSPGIGKTIILSLVLNALKCPAVYVCPPFLMSNVAEELGRWLAWDPDIALWPAMFGSRIAIVPDNMLSWEPCYNGIKNWVLYHRQRTRKEPTLIVDEAHRFKSTDSMRSQAMYEWYTPLFRRVVFSSGTPMPNRPIELFPVLHHLAPEVIDFGTMMDYGRKYCKAHRDKYGWKFTGAANLKELKERLPVFMTLIPKSKVLKDLPPKIERLVFIGSDTPPAVTALERGEIKRMSPEDLLKAKASPFIATYRRELGILKVPDSVEYIRFLLDEKNEDLLVFAYHTEVIEALRDSLKTYRPFVVTGKTHKDKRRPMMQEFARDKTRRLAVGNYKALGEGLPIINATRVVMVEYSWVPGDNDQASDRPHRIGQTKSVYVDYLAYLNSVDGTIMKRVLNKRANINQLY